MAENFGDQQNRVLDVKDRSLDNVVFQYRHPPLTSEWNLINQIGNEKIQSLAKASLPSGWLKVDDILQDSAEVDARTGNVLCSSAYTANSFKVASLNNNVAMVNGWPILVQGTNNTNDNNIIFLDEPTNQSYDFVFLEVWRKLVGTDDDIYPYGNVLSAPYSDNEIEWPSIGCETTKRVQIQYRIRSKKLTTTITDVTKEIFDLTPIYPIGGRSTETTTKSFRPYGSADPGLYISGDGSSTDETFLNTVDGYVYAIPMFIVYRRRLTTNEFGSTLINNTRVTKDMVATGYRSDRPDDKIVDIIYKDDIVDLRHRVIISEDLKGIVDTTISKLMAGELTTVLRKGFGEEGFINPPSSGGNTIMKVERVNSVSGDNIPDIGDGSDSIGNAFKRRAFCNAELTHDHNVIQINNAGVWAEGSFTIASKVTLPSGTIISVDGFYSPDQGLVSGVTSDSISITVADTGSESIVGTSNRLFMEFTFKYSSSPYGFKDVPKEFIEITKDDAVTIATRDHDILLKHNNIGELLNFGATSGEVGYPGDINSLDKTHYCGGNYTELSNFGHELVLNRTTTITGTVNLSLIDSKYNEYYILGIKSVEAGGILINFTSERVITTSPYAITNYILTMASYPSTNVIITLYTGSKFIEDVGGTYSIADSVKFFELSKQGKGIIDTYELIEAIAVEGASGEYTLDTGDKPIIKLATTAVTSMGFIQGTPFAYKFDSSDLQVAIADPTVNTLYPILNDSAYTSELLPTKMKILAAAGLVKLRVPVLVHSYVSSGEAPYNFYYMTTPYQGMLNTTGDSIYGKVIEESSALISTSGSGSIVDYTFSSSVDSGGTVDFIQNSRYVSGINTSWLSIAQSGDFIRLEGSSYFYRILTVGSDISITLSENYLEVTASGSNYEIVRLGIPNDIISNIVDKLPTYSIVSTTNITDYTCYSDSIDSDSGSILITAAKKKYQDPLNALTNDFVLGLNTAAKRGRNDFRLTSSGNTVFKVGEGRSYISYMGTDSVPASHNKKVYQFYLFMRSGKGYESNSPDLMGKVYLMVIAGETVSSTKNILNPFSDKDVVDIFELLGRPIIRG
jgi:hypothetical protein